MAVRQKQGNKDAERDCQAIGDAAPNSGQQGHKHKPDQAEQSRNRSEQPRHEAIQTRRQGKRQYQQQQDGAELREDERRT